MKTKRNIFIAFILNLIFSILELVGGIFIGSVAITSDAVHDFGDAASIGTAYLLEKKSENKPNKKYTYGYRRFSVIGGLITMLILLISSGIVIYNAIIRIITPKSIYYDAMVIFALIGLVTNIVATYFTHGGKSINQKAVHLHMLEDVLGWVVVLVGAIIIKFTNLYIIDPIMSIAVAVFIIVVAIKNLNQIIGIILMKTPKNLDVDKIIEMVKAIEDVAELHHLHVWSIDGEINCATMHLVVKKYESGIKNQTKETLKELGISHATIEMETIDENCEEKVCDMKSLQGHSRHCHHCH